MTSPAESVTILYDGSSYVNPTIGVANLPNGGQQQFVPRLTAREFFVPSRNQTSTYWGYGRLLVNGDGSIAFLEPQAVGQIDRNGWIRETKLSLRTYDMAKGPDGKLWVLGAKANNVVLARMNGDRSIASYPLPAPNFGQLVLGSDGNFWTAGQSSMSAFTDTVRRVSPNGTVTDFPIHGNDVWITGVVAGNDGRVWYVGTAEQQPGGIRYGMFVNVARDGSHTVTLRSIDPACCSAETTVSNPVWGQEGRLYTAVGYQYLGQLRETGSFRELPTLMQMETAAASPPTVPPMAAGPDGALWYAATPSIGVNGGFCTLGRMTTSGRVAFVFLASTCANTSNSDVLPSAIAAGPNKTLWYTRDDRVGKISL